MFVYKFKTFIEIILKEKISIISKEVNHYPNTLTTL